MITTIMNQKRGYLPDDGDPWAPNNLLKSGAKEKHQLNPGEPNNRQEAPVSTNKNQKLFVGAIIESDAGVQLKKAA